MTRSWIPRVPLASGFIFTIVGWVLVLLYAVRPSFGLELAWVHAVALGSFTTIALAVLVHAVAGFTGLTWRGQSVARAAASLLPLAVAGFVTSFAMRMTLGVEAFGGACAVLVIAYLVPAFATLAQRVEDRVDAAIARALVFVLTFLLATVVLGGMLAHAYVSGAWSVLRLAPAHAVLGVVGWLTLLTMGVSARTLRPLLGSAPRWPRLHIASNSLMMLAAIGGAIAAAAGSPGLLRGAFDAAFVAALLYGVDVLDRVRRAGNPHRSAHLFVAMSIVWLLTAAAAAALGWYELALVVGLTGWIGQMVNAHLHHIGMRVVATSVAGEDDDTRPWTMIDPRLSWSALVLAQVAVCAMALQWYVLAGIAGLAATASIGANAASAAARAARNAAAS